MGDPVFLTYDREALDREYNNRAKVANATEVLEWYARQSAAARAELACRLDIACGDHAGERLDVFPARGGGPAPVQVFIHGGYWHRLDKADFSYVARPFLAAGAAVAVVNYALMPAVTMDELVRQCRASLAWVWRNATSFGGDPGRVFVSGHSAGGHLVAMVMATDWPRFGDGLPADLVKAGTGISGLYDLEPIRLSYLNDVLALSPEDVERNSPARLLPTLPRPLTIAVGEKEGAEYHRQVEALVHPWRAHGVPLEVMDLAGHDHFSIMASVADRAAPLTRAILRQMGLADGE